MPVVVLKLSSEMDGVQDREGGGVELPTTKAAALESRSKRLVARNENCKARIPTSLGSQLLFESLHKKNGLMRKLSPF